MDCAPDFRECYGDNECRDLYHDAADDCDGENTELSNIMTGGNSEKIVFPYNSVAESH